MSAVAVMMNPSAMITRKRGRPAPASANQFERAYRGLHRLLELQTLPGGYRVRELEWTAHLGVNRAALRQAMARLEAEGLLVKLPRSGYGVPELTPEGLAEARETRFLLESGAIERICRAGQPVPDLLRPLETACARFQRLLGSSSGPELLEADREFHDALVAAAGNRKLIAIYRRASMPLFPPGVAGEASWRSQWPRVLQEHRLILEALRAGQASRAIAGLRKHLRVENPGSSENRPGAAGALDTPPGPMVF